MFQYFINQTQRQLLCIASSFDMKLSTSAEKEVGSTASAHYHSRRHHYREKTSST
jgi:hypothetical protein